MAIVKIQPGMRGADYVYLTPSIKEWLLANDIQFVIRYFVKPESTRINKDIKDEELEWLGEHGIAVVPNFERHHNDSNGGASAGIRNATEFLDVCERVGVPDSVPHIMSVDTDIYYANIEAAEEYMRAAAQVLGGKVLGLYGDDDIAYRIRDLAPIYWRANATGWDGQPKPVETHVQQHRALYPPGVDPNTALIPFFAWIPGESDYTGWKKGEAMGLFTKSPKQRLHDTRKGGTPLKAGAVLKVGIPATPEGNKAHTAILTVTVVNPSGSGHLQVDGDQFGQASDGNFAAGDVVACSTIAAVGDDGNVSIRISHGEAHVVVDLMGVAG